MIDLNTPLTEARFTVLDLETTGFKPPAAKITEIAAVQINRGEIGLNFSQVVNPGCAIPHQITEITGISDATVAGQPCIDDVWGAVRSFCGETIVVAHNAKFDMSFLDCDAMRLTGEPFPNPEVCTVKVSRQAWPTLPRHNLDTVAGSLELDFTARHRALGDVEVTARVLLRSFEPLARQGIETVGDLLKMQKSPRCQARLRNMGVSDGEQIT